MAMTDPIADMLTRIRNAVQAKHKTVSIPSSGVKKEIARILKEEGYIDNFSVIEDKKQGIIKVTLRYVEDMGSAITEIKRLSKPGCRKYVGKDDVPSIINGLGTAVLSTSKGLLSGKNATAQGVGGELLFSVY